MTTYGLSSTGWTSKDASAIKVAMRTSIAAATGISPNEDPDGPIDIFLSAVADAIAECWEAAGAGYAGFNRATASQRALDNICSLLFMTRQAATQATATVQVQGTNAVVVPAGSFVQTEEGVEFTTDADATLLGAGIDVDVTVTAVEYGSLTLAANTITEIVTPVSGWTSVDNSAAVSSGLDVETDAEFRNRTESAVSILGRGTVEAIYSRLVDPNQKPTNLEFAKVLEPESGGEKTGHIQVVVYPNTTDDEELADLIWLTKPAGVQLDGAQSYTITDSQGFEQTMYWDWATEVNLDVQVTITETQDYPADGDTQVATIVENYVNSLGPGDDVKHHKLVELISVGVAGLDELEVKTRTHGGGGYLEASWAVDDDEIPRFDDADTDITVTST